MKKSKVTMLKINIPLLKSIKNAIWTGPLKNISTDGPTVVSYNED